MSLIDLLKNFFSLGKDKFYVIYLRSLYFVDAHAVGIFLSWPYFWIFVAPRAMMP